MAKTLLYRLFGIGKIPTALEEQLRREFVIFEEEGIPGSATFRDFLSAGRYAKWSRQWYTASLALTEARLLALRYSRPIVDVPLTDQRLREMRIESERADTLLIAFDAHLFHLSSRGKIEYRFRTPQAGFYSQKIQERIA